MFSRAPILLVFYYSDNQKTLENEDDVEPKIMCIWCCYKANSFTSNLLNLLLSKIGLLTLHKGCVSCLWDYLKYYFRSWSRLSLLQSSGIHCILFPFTKFLTCLFFQLFNNNSCLKTLNSKESFYFIIYHFGTIMNIRSFSNRKKL